MANKQISQLTAKPSPVASTDQFGIDDVSSDSWKITVASLQTYFTTLYLALTGGTMTGSLTLNADPTTALMAATKQYVDNIAQGLNVQPSCVVATTTALTVTYNNGTAGVGATLTNAGAMAALSLDGVTVALNARVLVKNQASTLQNGIYTATNLGSGAANWVLTRATDYNTPAQITPGDFVLILSGTLNAQTQWIQTGTVTTVGTDPIVWDQFGADINAVITAIQNDAYNYILDTGAADAYVATLSPAITSYVAGQRLSLKIANANLTTTPTVAVNGLAAKTIILENGAVVPIGAMPAGMIADLRFDGTNYKLENPCRIPNSLLNVMADQTIKGNVSGGSAVPVDLTVAQTKTMLDLTTGQIGATTTNDSAASGKVGEYISSVVSFASAISLAASGTNYNVTSISLTAGDWDVFGNVFFNNATNQMNGPFAWTSITSATYPDNSLANGFFDATLGLSVFGVQVPSVRYSLAAPTTIYLSAQAQFAGGATTACGGIYARRRR